MQRFVVLALLFAACQPTSNSSPDEQDGGPDAAANDAGDAATTDLDAGDELQLRLPPDFPDGGTLRAGVGGDAAEVWMTIADTGPTVQVATKPPRAISANWAGGASDVPKAPFATGAPCVTLAS